MSLVEKKTCFKTMHSPNCVDVLLGNNEYAFEQTMNYIDLSAIDWFY